MSAREICQQFANKHRVVFVDKGECGFGRPCVGFTHGDCYIAFNPISVDPPNYKVKDLLPSDTRLHAPAGVDAYHKHDCLAVLAFGDEPDYEKAIEQLATWIAKLESFGDVKIVDYATEATGLQALFSGASAKAVVIESKVSEVANG